MYKIPANTLLIGKKVVFVPECHSTNNLALQLSTHSENPEGTIVITNHQLAGRGQPGNSWEAQPGMNLTLSLILKPKALAVRDQFYLNVFISLAVYDYIKEKTSAIVQIKWPNDIMVNSQKICGILIENQIQGSRFSNAIAGIGLNLNQDYFYSTLATSLKMITNVTYQLNDEFELLVRKLDARYLQLHQGRYSALKDAFLDVLYWTHEWRTFSSGGEEFLGRIIGIDDVGRLRIETDLGEKVYGLKEVSYMR